MTLRLLLGLLLLTSLVSCSGSKKEGDSVEDPEGVELAEDGEEDGDSEGDEESEDGEEVVDADEFVEDGEMSDDDEESAVASSGSSGPVEMSGTMQQYTVGQNETLMVIAFKLYGDFRKWRDLAKHNMNTLVDGQHVKPGMVIKYDAPVEQFVWTPEGEPYLIKWGDTLGTISNSVYGSMGKWKSIWNNNRVMIKDPNKIYAGFTIYYLPNASDVAANY